MRLTQSVAYAVSILLHFERGGEKSRLTAATLSNNCKFPPRYLYRILRRLVDAGLLLGISGPHGGYILAKRSKSITMLDIIRGVEAYSEITLVSACHKHRK